MSGLHIGMVGTRGVPATFGGVEHHVESLGVRLVERGHRVTVFAEEGYVGEDAPPTHRGIHVVAVPSVESKHLEAVLHAGRSTLQAMRSGVDVLHIHAIGPGWASPLPRYASRAAIVQTIHGLDAERAKWSRPARTMLRGATWLAANVPHTTITVSNTLARQFAERWGRQCTVIPNGVERRPRRAPRLITEHHGLSGGDYVLSLGRLVPEKQADRLIRAFAEVDTDLRLVVAGGSSYTGDYVQHLKELAARDERVVLPGYVYGDELDELRGNAAVFCQPSALEGLPLTLLEAIEARRPVVASAIPPHREVLANAVGDDPARLDLADSTPRGVDGFVLHDPDDTADLAAGIRDVVGRLDEHTAAAASVADVVVPTYSWDAATDALERVYVAAVAGIGRRRVGSPVEPTTTR